MRGSLTDSELEVVNTTDVQPTDDIPEEPEIILSDMEGQTYAPPPRIAARFYRPSNSRRKSSAASSRRNSISSTHSHQSNRSLRNNCQSNHVAQHLRRASILESRKARLADRAAHAEQVRLRAALAKATPRASNSEEKALAAQQARERHLAQVAAQCAEEVRRAKRVAEEMKERKAADERRYRLEMEERLADAEKRRLEYQRNARRPRTTSSPVSETKKRPSRPTISPEVAAKRIQDAWRTRSRKLIVEAWLELGLSIDKIHDTDFEEITALLNEKNVLVTTERIMSLFALLPEAELTPGGSAIRTFLSAYLLLGHPAQVMSRDGDQEQDLINKAKDLIITFESAVSKLTAHNNYTPSPTRLETVALAHGAFVTAFGDWKARDSSALIEGMIASFVNLDAIWQSVKDETIDEVANDYRNGIRDNQAILLSKIKKLAGHDRALTLIRKAVRESRRSRAKKRPTGDVRPRVAGSPVSEDNAAVQTAAASQLTEAQGEAPSAGHQATSLAKLFSVVPPNRVLIHELAIDKDFRIDPSPNADLRDALNREVCDSMLRGFENNEGAVWTVAMAENIRAKLLRLLTQGNSMYTLISETLDPVLIAQQCQHNQFSYPKFFNFMASILPKLCAPFRDAEVKALATELEEEGTIPEMIQKLFKLLHVIDLLALDYSNFLLTQAAPTLLKEGPGYEQRMFNADLESGTITLERTRRWWNSAAVNMHTEADRDGRMTGPTPQKIYARGLVDLAIATPPLRDSELPETLELDRERISRIRTDALRITTIGCILLTAKNLLKRDVRSQWKHEAVRIWDVLSPGYTHASTPAKIMSILESSHAMPPSTKSQLSTTISRLLSQSSTGKLSDAVMKVLFQRLKAHIFARVAADSSGERVRTATAAGEGLACLGLPEFVDRVGEMVEVLRKVGEVDCRAHWGVYESVGGELGLGGADGGELVRGGSSGSE